LHVASAAGAGPDESRLISRLAAGDADAAAELYDRYAGQVLALARRILRNDSDAEEVVQDVFSQVWRTAARYQPARGRVAAWLLVITRTRAIDRLRARQVRPEIVPDAFPEDMAAAGPSAPDRLLSDEEAARVRDALVTLPDAQRTALELAYYEGLTQSEIAARLTEPLGTVKTRIRTALAALRQRLRA
jgi:RNA polymerase sigma-70 factor (ECF subfamily)